MVYKISTKRGDVNPDSNRIPVNSLLFSKIIPTALFVLVLGTLGLMLFALGVIFGLVTF